MRTSESINAKGNSFDVYNGSISEVKECVTVEMQEDFNTVLEPYIRDLGKVECEGVEYTLFEAYFRK